MRGGYPYAYCASSDPARDVLVFYSLVNRYLDVPHFRDGIEYTTASISASQGSKYIRSHDAFNLLVQAESVLIEEEA
jgi:hypothetical protein